MTHRKTIGVGLISVGWMGRLHSRAYLAAAQHYPEIPVRAALVVAADPDEKSREYATDVLGYRESVSDYRAVLAHPDVDVVSICSPNFLHEEMALAAIAAGKPFWIEKPMGRGVLESRHIAEAASAAQVVSSVGFNYRNAPAVEHARRLVRDGALGTITNVRVAFMADYSADPLGALTWRFKRDLAGSGVLGDLLSHGADLAQYVVGRIVSVTAMTETFIPQRPLPASGAVSHFSRGTEDAPMGSVENEDYAALLARFAGGGVAVLESSRVSVGPRAQYVLEVYGTKGSLRWDFQRMNELEIADDLSGFRTVLMGPGMGDFARFQPGAGTGMGFDDLKTVEASLFLRSVLENRQYSASATDAWAAAEIVHAAQTSAETGAWVAVGETMTQHGPSQSGLTDDVVS
ncbi:MULTISPECIES: Gfo/Idh/MocA family protein [Subtercola]|uniref:Gfo/Idh/MocA family oxidoreductase n=1 Tax=Subtercola vilae TaxID=2056433 RepID=A0A4T2C7I4_9MICO|nr:Gfo/Idh/MocA family oxidoreductase [Subtercola vilae]MEA9986425.1 Gfo/Idh/MocA family oxidoreductase [Subtercola sp. RTI3]TIH40395.1 gfo/Idh/MocA family oxidoreductase [Subtercola vilae]